MVSCRFSIKPIHFSSHEAETIDLPMNFSIGVFLPNVFAEKIQ